MSIWSSFPFVRIAVCFVLGILLGDHLSQNGLPSITISASALFVIWFLLVLLKKRIVNDFLGSFLLILVMSLGILNHAFKIDSPSISRMEQLTKASAYIGTIESYPIRKEKYDIYDLAVTAFAQDSQYTAFNVKVRLNINRTEGSKPLTYGDKVLITGHPKRIPPPKNPGEFDYAQYMSRKNILLQHWINKKNLKLVTQNSGDALVTAVYRVRQYFESVINENIPSKEERAIASALLLGIKDDLNTETKEAYAATGAMHILAVSGLHVGILYFIILFLLRLIPDRRFRHLLTPILSIGLLWLYALLTGFSPSIFRAVTMFTLVIIGQHLSRYVNIYNSITVSAFVLLLADSNNLFSASFQLSYIAVVGIVYIHDKLHSLCSFESWLVQKAWSLTSVSIAAQVATTPISIYYFHQFPSYFWMTNLIAIPLASAIMVTGLTMIAFSWLPLVDWIGFVLGKLIWLLNSLVNRIHSFSGSTIEWLFLTPWQTVLFYFSLICLLAFFQFKKLKYAWNIGLATFLICIISAFSIWQQSDEDYVLFYSNRQALISDRVHGLSSRLVSTDSLLNTKRLEQMVRSHRIERHLEPPSAIKMIDTEIAIDDFAYLDVRDGKRYLYLHSKLNSISSFKKIHSDYLILSKNAVDDFEELEKLCTFKFLVIDASNRESTAKRLTNMARKKGIIVYNLHDQAALISL